MKSTHNFNFVKWQTESTLNFAFSVQQTSNTQIHRKGFMKMYKNAQSLENVTDLESKTNNGINIALQYSFQFELDFSFENHI